MSNPPFKVKAVFEYTSPHEDDLHFPNGQIITVTEEEDDDWYSGNYVDASGVKQEGIFPKNFVEKYEPQAPPRPIRTNRPKKEEPAPEPVAEPEPAPVEPVYIPEPEPEPQKIREPPPAAAREPPPAIPKQAEIPPPSQPKPIPSSSKPSGPPPVSEKPSGGSFRDRIAAFNKAAPPVAPFKPGGLSSGGSNNFIKKPFVAPPPSKNAYVPVIREPPPQKIYKREEDPEIVAKESENQELAERAGLAPQSNDNAEEEQPKPTSLKERIALLQKQQMEQAARHADAAQKKEKPKRPAKKRTESHEQTEAVEEGDGSILERQDTGETMGKHSMDSAREQSRRRKSSRGTLDVPGDGNEADMSGAGDTTEEPEDISTGRDDSDEKPKQRASMLPPPRAPVAPAREPDVGEEEGASEEETPAGEDEEEEEDDIDPEVRRKEELRARMAKMSGGMGMHGMFGGGMPMPAPMAPPKKKKPSVSSEKRADSEEVVSPRAPPVPMIPMPGMSRVRSPEEVNRQLEEEERTPVSATRPADEVPDIEEVVPERSAPRTVPTYESNAPPIPGGRPAPPPVPKESRPSVPAPMSPSAGSESDDESSIRAEKVSTDDVADAPPPPPRPTEGPGSPKSPSGKRMSYFGSDQVSPTSPTTPGGKRMSRLPPPIPGAVPAIQNRAPPPPPPAAAPLSRNTTGDQHVHPTSESVPQDSEEEVTEYEGDYDTDIASAVPHKDALKAHAREPSLDDSIQSPVTSPTTAPPPLPPTGPPRAVPPPLPSQPPPPARQSTDMPRAAPPPPPPSKMPAPWEQQDDEYDPYNYAATKSVPTTPGFVASPPPRIERNEEDIYGASPPRTFAQPGPPAPGREPSMMSGGRAPPRQSLDVSSRPLNTARRSVELGRMSMDSGFVANDVDLGRSSFWWTQPKGMPPVFQGRRDVLFEQEESSAVRNGKTIVTKELYVLYQDYSQTIIEARFDAQNPSDVKLEQRHEQPPARLRQDQLEQAHDQFGRRISEAVVSKKETVVGDGTPHGLITELLKPLTNALLPIGTRGFGAVIYSNLANASTQQNDEIRPGDIITLRNTKFQGKHGPMHAKYSTEVGKPDHVGIVAEWDGTKKKVRAWEQGRESKKVKMESFKLDDLRSGEVKIWRVMPRSWVGWSGGN